MLIYILLLEEEINAHCLSQKCRCHPRHLVLFPHPVSHEVISVLFLNSLESIHFSVFPTATVIFCPNTWAAAPDLPTFSHNPYSGLYHIPSCLTLHCFKINASPLPWLDPPPRHDLLPAPLPDRSLPAFPLVPLHCLPCTLPPAPLCPLATHRA